VFVACFQGDFGGFEEEAALGFDGVPGAEADGGHLVARGEFYGLRERHCVWIRSRRWILV